MKVWSIRARVIGRPIVRIPRKAAPRPGRAQNVRGRVSGEGPCPSSASIIRFAERLVIVFAERLVIVFAELIKAFVF